MMNKPALAASGILLAASLALAPAPVQAQAKKTPPAPVVQLTPPMQAARKTLDALRANKLDEFTASMHPEAVKNFQTLMLAAVEAANKEGKAGEVLTLFDGVADVESLRKLDAPGLFTAFLKGVMGKDADLRDVLTKSNFRLLGQALEGEDTAHVPYRFSYGVGKQNIQLTAVISVRKHGDGWASQLTGDFEGIVQLIQARFGGAKPEGIPTPVRTVQVLGLVPEGKARTHVVCRWITQIGEGRFTKITSHYMEPNDEGWKFLQRNDIPGLTALLQKNYAPN